MTEVSNQQIDRQIQLDSQKDRKWLPSNSIRMRNTTKQIRKNGHI